MPKSSERLDNLLVSRGLAENGSRAKALVMAGLVWHGECRMNKPGVKLDLDSNLEVRGSPHPWVSRGGLKLEHALAHFSIPVFGLVCLDIGASTGGFTDVLLAKGAGHIYAVDVGHGQLAWKLRKNPRITVLERCNARYIGPRHVPQSVDLIVCDVSFISLSKVLPKAMELAVSGTILVALIKPQFEAGKRQVGKGGVISDPLVRKKVCSNFQEWVDHQKNWKSIGLTVSPITGAKGNVEYFLAARRLN